MWIMSLNNNENKNVQALIETSPTKFYCTVFNCISFKFRAYVIVTTIYYLYE